MHEAEAAACGQAADVSRVTADLLTRIEAELAAHRAELERDLADVNAGELIIRWNLTMGTIKLEVRVTRTYTGPRGTLAG